VNPKELVRRTLAFESPEKIPRQIWILPWAERRYPAAVRQLRREYPDDIVNAPEVYTRPPRRSGDRYSPGTYVDEWGCVFSNNQDGAIGIVKKPQIDSWEDLSGWRPPEETLTVDREAVNRFCRETDRFVLSATMQRPFERLQFLRTMERAMVDVKEQPPELFDLLRLIHEHYCKEVDVWSRTDVDAIGIMDDWGAQGALLTSPQIFRDIFKPMYCDYIEIARSRGKSVFMHSDGYILDIVEDLIEIGVDALNSQIFCMDIKKLGERFRGRLTFWGEIDRQTLLPRGSRNDIQKAVDFVFGELFAQGGVIAQCEFGLEAKPENVLAVFQTWSQIDSKLSSGAIDE
jgi:uroporphyrinogen decarboxylase